jgi:hypothetical protein
MLTDKQKTFCRHHVANGGIAACGVAVDACRDDGSAQIEDFKISQGDRLDLSGTTFDKHDLKDTFDNDRDGDGNYVRETSANGKPETALHFNNPDITDSLNLIGVTARDLRHDVRDHPTHYDFG